MPVDLGTISYDVGCGDVLARGFVISKKGHVTSLRTSVSKIINDENGVRRAKEAVATLSLTDFEQTNLDAILNPETPLEDWRVGEAYGEAYLTEHRRCFFPWPDKWDERKSGSSLPGADLAGMQETDDVDQPFRFAFGEVKTSEQKTYPPGTMHGRTGLKQQLEDLRNIKEIRDVLVRYLTIRAYESTWKAQFQSAAKRYAAKRYLADSCDVAIFGILIRDVPPDQRDLQARSRALADGHPPKMHIELFAIYLPAGSISRLAAFYSTANGGG